MVLAHEAEYWVGRVKVTASHSPLGELGTPLGVDIINIFTL